MENQLLTLARWFGAAPGYAVRHRVWILLLIALVSVVQAYGLATQLRIDVSIDSMIDRADPAIAALDSFRSQFGSDDAVLLVYEAVDGDVFSAASLRRIRDLTEQLRATALPAPLDQIRRVQSISTLRIVQGDSDTLRSVHLLPDQIRDDPAALAAIRELALAQQDYQRAFYSADGRFGAVLVQTTFGARPADGYVPAVNADNITLDDMFSSFSDAGGLELAFNSEARIDEISYELVDMVEYKQFMTAIDAVLQEYSDQFIFYPAGNPPLMAWVFDVLEQMLWLALGVVAIFVLLLRALFRSFSAVVWPIVTILLSLLWGLGFMVWAGTTFSTMLSLTVMLVFATGVADCVHVMSAYFMLRRGGHEHTVALSKAYEKTGLAILVTTLTTMAGVLALTGSDLIPIQVFGLSSALGVFMTLAFTVVLLPILLSYWPPGTNTGPRDTGSLLLRWELWILAACPRLALSWPRSTVAVFALIFLASLYGTSQVRIDSNVAEMARENSAPTQAFRLVDEHLAGVQSIIVMIDTGRVDGMMEPVVLQAMAALQARVAERYSDSIARSYSLVNVVRDTHQAMNGDDATFHRIPDSAVMVSQLLYLFGTANPEERRSLVSDDFSRGHVTLNSFNAGSYEYQALIEALNTDLDTLFADARLSLPALQVTITGSIPVMMRAMDEIARSQYSSLLLALAVISAIMVVTLGSLQAGLISVVPNLIPALMTFGLMGLLGITLDADTLLIAPVIISVAVDDTIHFMTSYRMELIRTRNMQQALSSTLRNIGRAVLFTTLILGLGFAVLGFSEYLGIAKIGIFGGLAILMALLCDLMLLPALLKLLKPRFGLKGKMEGFDESRFQWQEEITA